MPAADIIHDAVKNALIKDGWTITHDPYVIKYEELTLQADLGAERPIAAERAGRKIVVEAKSFLGPSLVEDLKVALGQYDIYRTFLAMTAPERKVYLAISDLAYSNLGQRKAFQALFQALELSLFVVNLASEEIEQWIN